MNIKETSDKQNVILPLHQQPASSKNIEHGKKNCCCAVVISFDYEAFNQGKIKKAQSKEFQNEGFGTLTLRMLDKHCRI